MKKRFVSDKQQSLTECLCAFVSGVPRSRLIIQIKRGEVKVNGVRVRSNVNLNKGDFVELFLPLKFFEREIEVVYDDDDILIADKPPFTESESALPELIYRQTGTSVRAAHRLDTNTSGIIILAKTDEAMNALIKAFKNGQVAKTYRAEVFGCPPENSGRITAYLLKESDDAYCKVYSKPVSGAMKIITEYEVIRRGEISVLNLHPVTGRTHQLRAHMAFIGCPIVGDEKYGNCELNKRAGAKIQRLRAVRLELGELDSPLDRLSGKKFSVSFDKYNSGIELT